MNVLKVKSCLIDGEITVCDNSKRVGSRYASGRTDNWVKVKNPSAPAVRREAKEDR